MALSNLSLAFFVVTVLAFAKTEITLCHQFKGFVSCIDCNPRYDYSGIKVLVECDNSKVRVIATSKKDGSFVEEPRNISPTSNCQARILGGPRQLYTSQRNMVSKVYMAADHPETFTATLTFAASCSRLRKLGMNCGASNSEFGSSKTIDFPVPGGYGLAPSIDYFPVVPIIGVP